jgi:branched-chain amino acid transport system substrate-binding protein
MLASLAATAAGCTAPTSSSVTVSGGTLTIYASEPAQTGNSRLSHDLLDAEQLALHQSGTQIGKFTIKFLTLTGKISDNARKAIKDSSAIAYLGEIAPHSSYASLGITNALDLLQVSPTDTGLELTQTTPAVPGAPSTYYESLSTYGRTFARVVPSTALEAKGAIEEMQSLHVKRLYVSDDGGPYGKAIALAVRQAASPYTVVSSPTGADAVFYGSNSDSAAARALDAVAQASPAVKMFGPSALDDAAFASALSPAARNVYISSPGFLPQKLTAAGKKFVSDFTASYGHAPATQAIFGYEAMAAVLSVLREAGSSANNRSTVVHDFFAIKNRPSVLGTYSINVNGDTSLAPFVFSRLSGGALVPFKFVQVQG